MHASNHGFRDFCKKRPTTTIGLVVNYAAPVEIVAIVFSIFFPCINVINKAEKKVRFSTFESNMAMGNLFLAVK